MTQPAGSTTISEITPTDGQPTAVPIPPSERRRRIVRRNGQRLQRTEETVVSVPLPPAEPPEPTGEAPPAVPVPETHPARVPVPEPFVMVGARRVTADQLEAVETLGISKKKWDNAKRLAIEQLGDYLNVPFVGKILMIDGFDGIDQVQFTMKFCREIMEATPERLKEMGHTIADKMTAGELMTLCFKPLRDFIDQGVELSEKLHAKRGGDDRPKNRPPMVGLQVNVTSSPNGGGQSTSVARIGFPDGKPIENQ